MELLKSAVNYPTEGLIALEDQGQVWLFSPLELGLVIEVEQELALVYLRNGQTVEIITKPNNRPNPAWLDFVVTGKARATIRSFLKSSFWTELGMHRLWWTGAYDSQELVHYEKIRHDPEMSTAFQLQKVISTTHEEARSCGVELLNIRYEDFVTDPSGVIDRILQAAGLPSSKWIERKLHFSPIHDRNRR